MQSKPLQKLSHFSTVKRRCLYIITATYYFVAVLRGRSRAPEDMLVCPRAVSKIRSTATSWVIPREILAALNEVEHIFVLAKYDCSKKLPSNLDEKVTCIRGVELDRCAPQKYLRGSENHAMKVTYVHAFVMMMAHEARYSTIAVIEEDAIFLERNFSSSFITDFTSLVHSNGWGLIRFGFRPFFLQMNGIRHCPRNCRCSTSDYGDHFCRMRNPGCDMRSSDMYIIHQTVYLQFGSDLLNIRVTNRRRIVDTLPMNRISPQWLVLPQCSFQETLDVPIDYQVGISALYMRKCVGPRPLPDLLRQQVLQSFG